jgi:hypothetical protein
VKVETILDSKLDINIFAEQNVNTLNLRSTNGDVIIEAKKGSATIGGVLQTNGGDAYIRAFKKVISKHIISKGGDVFVISDSDFIRTGYIRTDSEIEDGNVYLKAGKNIKVFDIVNVDNISYSIYTGEGQVYIAQYLIKDGAKRNDFFIGNAGNSGTKGGVKGDVIEWTLPSVFYPQPPLQLSPLHKKIVTEANNLLPSPNTKEWSNALALRYGIQKEISEKNAKKFVNDFKNQWVSGYKNIIIQASNKFDIPSDLLAAVAWAEVAGDPSFLDDYAYSARALGIYRGSPSETSFGNTSVQLRRAAEALGYDLEQLDQNEKATIISSLQDPRQNLFIAAKHLSDIVDKYLPNTSSDQISDKDKLALAGAYNRGPVYPTLEDFWRYPGNGKNYAGGYGRDAFEGLHQSNWF